LKRFDYFSCYNIMKFLGIFGLLGTLSTFAIIIYMFSKMTDSVSPVVGNINPADTNGNKENGGSGGTRLLALPPGSELRLRHIGTAFSTYQIDTQDTPHAQASSNEILRTMFLSSPGMGEANFYMQGSFISSKKPDEITAGGKALEAGENHWAFIKAPKPLSSYGTIPVLIEPFRPGETSFRQEDYGKGRDVLVLFSDGSVRALPINENGEAVIGRVSILSADYTPWNGDTPQVYQPEP
jgi:hypothetical protein